MLEHERDVDTGTETIKLSPGLLTPGTRADDPIPLCQRLITALISEEEYEEFHCSGNENFKFDEHGIGVDLDLEMESNSLNHQSLGNYKISGCAAFNGYRISVSGRSLDNMENDEPESTGIMSNVGDTLNGSFSDHDLMPSIACSEFQYNSMSLNERLLLEIRSIGIFPELVVGSLS